MKLFGACLRTPDSVVFDGQIASLTIEQSDGYTTFLGGHANSFGTFERGVLRLVDDKDVEQQFVTENGVFIVQNSTLSVCSALIERGDEPKSVFDRVENEKLERRQKHERSRKEYARGKMEMAKSLMGVDDEED